MSTLRMYLEDTYGEEVRSVYRHFALSFHTKAPITGEAVEAAGAQGKFWEMHDLLYERQQVWGQLPDEQMPEILAGYAAEIGLDAERFAQDLEDHVYLPKVEGDTEIAMQAGLTGTPSYIVNGVVYPTQELGLAPARVDSFIQLLTMQSEQYTEAPPQVLEEGKDYEATISTTKGDIVAELFADQAPVNTNSFAFLAQEGWYDGLDFFYVQQEVAAYTGDPTNMGWGIPFPGYYCGDEITPDSVFDEPGLLALFTPQPGRNSSMFFITYAAQPSFDGRFTIIGRLTDGMDVLEALAAVQPGDGIAPDSVESVVIEER